MDYQTESADFKNINLLATVAKDKYYTEKYNNLTFAINVVQFFQQNTNEVISKHFRLSDLHDICKDMFIFRTGGLPFESKYKDDYINVIKIYSEQFIAKTREIQNNIIELYK
jgi:hypothetical protein